MEPSNGWGLATQLMGEAIQIADGGTLPRVLFTLCLLSVISIKRNHEAWNLSNQQSVHKYYLVIVLINSQQIGICFMVAR